MPEEVGGQPSPDGEEPEDDRHGGADEEFAAVVLDEAFVRAAEVHEATAAERMLAAAQSHAETEVPHAYDDGYVYGPAGDGDTPPDYDPDADGTTHGYGFGYDPRRRGAFPHEEDHTAGGPDAYGAYGYDDDGSAEGDGPYGSAAAGSRPYRGHVRWQRPVAWVLAVLMGVGLVALAFAAVYRGASGQRNEPAPPPPSTGMGAPAVDHAVGHRPV